MIQEFKPKKNYRKMGGGGGREGDVLVFCFFFNTMKFDNSNKSLQILQTDE